MDMSQKQHVIPLLDKEWYNIITSIRHMDPVVAVVMLEEMYEKIPILFGFPKKKLMLNEYDDMVMKWNPDYYEAVDWINFHAGWEIDKEGKANKHPVRKLQERFTFNIEIWDKKNDN